MAVLLAFFLIQVVTVIGAESLRRKECVSSQYQCLEDGHCIPDTWLCDGERDCDDGSDEHTCESDTRCNGFKCKNNHCIPSASKCDGQNDCDDGSDEEFCSEGPSCHTLKCSQNCRQPTGDPECFCNKGFTLGKDGKSCEACEGYTCPVSGECISWSRVCDGEHDCSDLRDEGSLCARSCTCDHRCQKTPQGPKCSCYEGFVLAEDGTHCEDCNTPGKCSQFCDHTRDGFQCSCAEGYILATDQRTCKAAGGEAYLAYLVAGGIRGLNLGTTFYHRVVYIGRNLESVMGMDYDAADGIFFWADRKEINSWFHLKLSSNLCLSEGTGSPRTSTTLLTKGALCAAMETEATALL